MGHNNASKHKQPARSRQAGFTLVELLATAVLGGILLVGAAELILSHVRFSARTEAMMRAQDVWTRIQFLMDQEIQEASCLSSTSSSSITLSLPPCGTGARTITYSLSGSNLIRTGPGINVADGSLDLSTATNSTATVARNISSFSASINSDGTEAVTYSLNISDPSGFQFSQAKTTGARTRSRIINN